MINKIYFLNLDSKIERWNNLGKIKDLKNIEMFPAINSVENPMIYKDYGLELNPVGFAHTLYFSSFYGAVGCYLSHYEMWKEIVNNKWESVLILEDDISKKSLNSFLRNFKIEQYINYDLIQLSSRIGFGGTECYWLNYKAAKKLIKNTHDSTVFENIKPAEVITKAFIKYEYIKIDEWDWNNKNSIVAPVDRFLYYSINEKIKNPIKWERRREILLDYNLVFDSSIEDENSYFKNIWPKEKMKKFIKSKQYEWWENK